MHFGTALETPRWALSFYRRHLPLVLGVCLVPAVERFTGQLAPRSPPVGTAAELATLGARVLLVVLVVRIVLLADPVVGRLGRGEARRRARTSLPRHTRSLLAQGALLAVLFVLADVVPEQVVPALVDVGPPYWAGLLALKNLTVIPFTLIWCVGVARQLVLAPAHDRPREPTA